MKTTITTHYEAAAVAVCRTLVEFGADFKHIGSCSERYEFVVADADTDTILLAVEAGNAVAPTYYRKEAR